MPDLCVLVPVLGRPANLVPLAESFAVSGAPGALHIVCSESDTSSRAEVERLGLAHSVVPDGSGSWPGKVAAAFPGLDAAWMLLAADDLTFHPGWWDATATARADPAIRVIGTNDTRNPRVVSGRHATHALVRHDVRALDEAASPVSTAYRHWYVDDELVATALARQEWAFCAEARVEHRHPYWDELVAWDDTYTLGEASRADDEATWRDRARLVAAERARRHPATDERLADIARSRLEHQYVVGHEIARATDAEGLTPEQQLQLLDETLVLAWHAGDRTASARAAQTLVGLAGECPPDTPAGTFLRSERVTANLAFHGLAVPPLRQVRRSTVCLNMIVRDEAHIITEALASVVPLIDTWVIVDTGSTDGTMEVVREFFTTRGIPGVLHERTWRDFGTNRSEALALARDAADYTLVLDADDVVVGDLDLASLTADVYLLRFGTDLTWWRTQIFRSALAWRYEGVLHEYAVCDDETGPPVRLEGEYHVEGRSLGARSARPDKYERDARMLLAAHAEEPDEPRTVFYLAQSHLSAGDVEAALDWYTRRVEMGGGFVEEIFYARLQRARCLERLGRPWEETAGAYLAAWQERPARAEPLYELARMCRLAGHLELAHLFACQAGDITRPDDLLFVADDVYRWRIRDERAISAFYVGAAQECLRICDELLADGSLPEAERPRVEANRAFAVQALAGRDRVADLPPSAAPLKEAR